MPLPWPEQRWGGVGEGIWIAVLHGRMGVGVVGGLLGAAGSGGSRGEWRTAVARDVLPQLAG